MANMLRRSDEQRAPFVNGLLLQRPRRRGLSVGVPAKAAYLALRKGKSVPVRNTLRLRLSAAAGGRQSELLNDA